MNDQDNETYNNQVTVTLNLEQQNKLFKNMCFKLEENKQIIKKLQESIQQKKAKVAIYKQEQCIPQSNTNSLSKYFSKAQQSNSENEKFLKSKIKQTITSVDKIKKQLNKLVKKRTSYIGSIKLIEQIQKRNTKKDQLQKLNKQKSTIQKYISTVGKDLKDNDLEALSQKLYQQKSEQVQLMNAIKTQKNCQQQSQKQDRVLTEKMQFLVSLLNRRDTDSKLKTEVARDLSVQIKGISSQMQIIIQQRQDVDIKTKKTLDQLKLEIKGIQSQNWGLINKLREHDSFLLKYYNSESKKKYSQNSLIYNSIHQVSAVVKQPEIIVQPTIKTDTAIKSKILYQVSRKNKIRLSDYQLKPDKLLSLQLIHNNSILLGISAKYKTSFGVQSGYRISPFPLPKQSQKLVFEFNNNQLKQFQIGFSKQDEIVSIKFLTQNEVSFSWKQNQPVSIQKKVLASPIKIWLSGTLGPATNGNNPNSLVLKGIGFQIITLVENN